MDTSEQYIKMCGEAKEVQREWRVSVGDFCCFTERNHNNSYREPCVVDEVEIVQGITSFSLAGLKNHYVAAWFYTQNNVWLPRQDQLQEVVLSHYGINHPRWAIQALIDGLGDEIDKFSSHEQVWLGFVMHERFLKTWDGGEWKNVNDTLSK